MVACICWVLFLAPRWIDVRLLLTAFLATSVTVVSGSLVKCQVLIYSGLGRAMRARRNRKLAQIVPVGPGEVLVSCRITLLPSLRAKRSNWFASWSDRDAFHFGSFCLSITIRFAHSHHELTPRYARLCCFAKLLANS